MNLNQVTVPSTDVARSITFYTTLGLRLIVENLPTYARFECPNGDATFSVSLGEHGNADGGVVVYFECADLDATVAALQQRGVHFDDAPHDQRWLWREAHLRDPDENRICLYVAGNNRRNPPWRITAQEAAVGEV